MNENDPGSISTLRRLCTISGVLVPLPPWLIVLRPRYIFQVRIVILVVPIAVSCIEISLVFLGVLVLQHVNEAGLWVLLLLVLVYNPEQHLAAKLKPLPQEQAKDPCDSRLVGDVRRPGREAHCKWFVSRECA